MSLWREYAADPAVFCRTWAECKHVLDGIGWNRGRLVAEYPKKWRRLFYDCLQKCEETPAKKLRIVERFKQFIGTTEQERLRSGLVPTSRVYIPKNTWLESALEANRAQPFSAIVAVNNPSNHPDVLQLDDLHDGHALWKVEHSRPIDRSITTLKNSINILARLSRNLIVIDPYLDPAEVQSIIAIEAYLDSMSVDLADPPSLTLHYGRDTNVLFHSQSHEKDAKARLRGVMRSGQHIHCCVWRKPAASSPDRERFHDRFIISELGGIGIQGGAGVASKGQHTSVYFLSDSDCQNQLNMFDSKAPAFELLCRFDTF